MGVESDLSWSFRDGSRYGGGSPLHGSTGFAPLSGAASDSSPFGALGTRSLGSPVGGGFTPTSFWSSSVPPAPSLGLGGHEALGGTTSGTGSAAHLLAKELYSLRTEVAGSTRRLSDIGAEVKQERTERERLQERLPQLVDEMVTTRVQALQESFQRELAEWASAQRALESRCNQMREAMGKQEDRLAAMAGNTHEEVVELRSRFEALSDSVREEVTQQAAARERNAREAREALAVEGRAREAIRESVRESLKRHLETEAQAREHQAASFAEVLDSRLAQERASYRQQIGVALERIAKAEQHASQLADRRALEALADTLREELQGRLWEYHGTVREPCAALKERMDYLENVLGESTVDTLGRRPGSPTASLAGDSPARTRSPDRGFRLQRGAQDWEGTASPPSSPGSPQRSPTRLSRPRFFPRAGASVAERLGRLERAVAEEDSRRVQEGRDAAKDKAKFKERFEAIERLMGEVAVKQQQDLQKIQARLEQEGHLAQLRVDQEGQARSLMQASLRERTDAFEGVLHEMRDALAKRAAEQREEIQECRDRLEKRLQEEVKVMAEQVAGYKEAWRQHYETVREHLAGEKKAREAQEQVLKEQGAQERKAREALHSVVQDHLKSEKEARDVFRAALQERTAALERAIGDPGSFNGGLAINAAGKAAPLRVRLAGVEEALESLGAKFASEQKTRSDLGDTLLGRLEQVERRLAQSAHDHSQVDGLVKSHIGQVSDAHARDLRAAISQLREEIQVQFENERSARKSLGTMMQEHVASERSARATQHTELHDRAAAVESRLGEELAVLREHVTAESLSHRKHHEAVQDQLASERRAREAHEAAQHEAREAHERTVRERLVQEREARERHREEVRAHISSVREGRGHSDPLELSIAGGSDFGHRLGGGLGEDLVEREREARLRFEDRMEREHKELESRQQALAATVDRLKHSVAVLEQGGGGQGPKAPSKSDFHSSHSGAGGPDHSPGGGGAAACASPPYGGAWGSGQGSRPTSPDGAALVQHVQRPWPPAPSAVSAWAAGETATEAPAPGPRPAAPVGGAADAGGVGGSRAPRLAKVLSVLPRNATAPAPVMVVQATPTATPVQSSTTALEAQPSPVLEVVPTVAQGPVVTAAPPTVMSRPCVQGLVWEDAAVPAMTVIGPPAPGPGGPAARHPFLATLPPGPGEGPPARLGLAGPPIGGCGLAGSSGFFLSPALGSRALAAPPARHARDDGFLPSFPALGLPLPNTLPPRGAGLQPPAGLAAWLPPDRHQSSLGGHGACHRGSSAPPPMLFGPPGGEDGGRDAAHRGADRPSSPSSTSRRGGRFSGLFWAHEGASRGSGHQARGAQEDNEPALGKTTHL